MRHRYKQIMAKVINRRKRLRQQTLQRSRRESEADKTNARATAVFETINKKISRIKGAKKPVFDDSAMAAIRAKILPGKIVREKSKAMRFFRRLPIFAGMPKRKLVEESFGRNGEKLGLP